MYSLKFSFSIKDIFHKYEISGGLSKFADNDIKLLSFLSVDSFFLKAKNGRQYFYYRLADNDNIDLATFLMARNGLKAKVHKSYYFYSPLTVLRVRSKSFLKNADLRMFVKSIKPAYSKEDKEMQSLLNKARMQMKQNIK